MGGVGVGVGGSGAKSRSSSGTPKACEGRSLSHRSACPLFPAPILGPPPPLQHRAPAQQALPGSPARPLFSCSPESPWPQMRPLPPLSSRGASPVRLSNAEARTPSARGQLPREGARPPPRLLPLRGAAAIWGPCQSRPLRGPCGARTGGGSLTGLPPACACALRCPEGTVAASRAWVEARLSGRGAPCHLGDPSGAGTRAPEAAVGGRHGRRGPC